MIEKLYKNGKEPIEQVKAVTKTKCNRCLGKNIYEDTYGLYHCLDCFQYGEINDKMTLYRFKRNLQQGKHALNLDFELSNLQKQGSDFLLECYNSKRSGFLQAVCGAGKTEMTYQTILKALNSQDKICFVIPRVEVLKEISVRLKKAFPKTNISVLYEGNKHYEESELLLSTPQQLIYFYREFDLIILDEVDAFPYSGNHFLERLVKKSSKSMAVMLYMSATVSKDFLKTMKDIKTFLIPSRYHLKPMIIPKFIKIKNNQSLFKKLKGYLDYNQANMKQALLFVPTIAIGNELNNCLESLNYKVASISSKTTYKSEIIKRFRNQEITFLITTTILERGVTFSNIDVFILYADHQVYNKESLIQISGRVGRDLLHPDGLLLFFSEYLSKAMKQTRNELIYMNCRNQEIEMQNL
ncbi:MAG: DEAD/DEAH box helicase family protein [Tenericutes bacterium]|nr:DEAD/DEAH box helicase family protein [Mycoplasmatota bacterium]